MPENGRVIVVPKVPQNFTIEYGYKLGGNSVGTSHTYNTSLGEVKVEVVNGGDLIPGIGYSHPENDPTAIAYAITLPRGGPWYVGWDNERGLILGVRAEGMGSGYYLDFGVQLDTVPGQSNIFSFKDSKSYFESPDGTLTQVGEVVGLPGGGAMSFQRDNTGKLQAKFQPYMNPMMNLGSAWTKCFTAGTEILLSDGTSKKIEAIEIGDTVKCFAPFDSCIDDDLQDRKVARIFRNFSKHIIDLRGLKCTPGHVFFTGKSRRSGQDIFEPICKILSADGTLVDVHGAVIRARTGAPVDQLEDRKVLVSYEVVDGDRSIINRVYVRAGIPILVPDVLALGCHVAYGTCSLLSWMLEHSIKISTDGSLCTTDGQTFDAIDWPLGSTPFDTIEMQNWVVTGPDGQPYTPPWIADLPEEDERANLRVVGEMPGVSLSAL